MVRPLKQGIDYFPLDCYFMDDIKIRKILRACGPSSIAVLVDLLGNIYRDEGYYMRWDDDICFLVADKVGTNEASVSEVVQKAVQVDFFDQALFDERQILTSTGIQVRYLEATRRRKEVKLYQEFTLIDSVRNDFKNVFLLTETDDSEVNVNRTEVNVNNNEQSKVKESKVKESRVKHTTSPTTTVPKINSASDADIKHVLNFYQQNFGLLSPYTQQDLINWLEVLELEVILEAMKEAVERNKPYNYAKSIMQRWMKSNIKTLADVEADRVGFERQQSNYQRQKAVTVAPVPEWLNDTSKPAATETISPQEQAKAEERLRKFLERD